MMNSKFCIIKSPIVWIIFLFCAFNCSAVYAITESAVSDNIPWSGWWWPETKGGLATGEGYRNHPAPLEKYDLLTSNIFQGPATKFYLENNYDPSALDWFGLCDAWAAAAIMEPIDFSVSTAHNLFFYIGDKKGLLTLSHEMDFNTGESAASSSPVVLHTWLQEYIRDQKKAFYADLDPGPESWNYPIYKYTMDITDLGDEAYVVCKIWYADNLVDPDYPGTRELTKTYRYTLFKGDGGYIGGEWLGESIADHPQILVSPGRQSAKNPYLEYDFIKGIAESTDDAIESDLVVAINPGMYNLVLMNQDRYLINADGTDTVFLTLEKVDETDEGIDILIKDAKGDTVYSGLLSDVSKIPIHGGEAPFELKLSKEDYENPGLYKLEYDIKKQFEFARPKAQRGYGWGGYAILNSNKDDVHGITVSGYTRSGVPVDSFLGPFSLSYGEKKIVFSADFPFRNQLEKQDFYGIKIHSPEPLQIVNLSGTMGTNMALFQQEKFNRTLVVPENPNYNDFAVIKSWGIYNPSISTAAVKMTLYSENGIEKEKIEIAVDPKECKQYKRSTSPFGIDTDNSWIKIESEQELTGYEEWISRQNNANETIPALIPGKKFYLPNATATNGWSTQILLINTSEKETAVSITLLNSSGDRIPAGLMMAPYEKVQKDLSKLFADVSVESISNAIIEIEAENEVAGFYTYRNVATAEYIALPLTFESEIKTEHIVPHIASDNYWWTGVTLCNTGDSPSLVRLLPYNHEGKLMDKSSVELDIGIFEKINFLISDLFDVDATANMSHIRVSVEQGSPVFGSYGYGSSDLTMLAGSKLN